MQNEQILKECLASLKEIESLLRQIASAESTSSSNLEKSNNLLLEKDIVLLLKDLGIKPKLLGFDYLKTAILFSYNDPKMKAVTTELYPKVAKEYSVTPSKVERGIRTAIHSAWQTTPKNVFEDIFGYIKRTPTNHEFIAGICQYLKN